MSMLGISGEYLPLAEAYQLVRKEKRFKIHNSTFKRKSPAIFESIDGKKIITTTHPKIIHVEDADNFPSRARDEDAISYMRVHALPLHGRIESMEKASLSNKIVIRPRYEQHSSELNVYAKQLGMYPLRNKYNSHNTEIYRKNPYLFEDEWDNMQAVFETTPYDQELVSKIIVVGSNPLIVLNFLDTYLRDEPTVIA